MVQDSEESPSWNDDRPLDGKNSATHSCVDNGPNVISLVIVNKGERDLSQTLDALESSVGPILDEVLVVDASGGELEDIRISHPWARWIDFEQPLGSRTTIAQQRNIGVRSAIGDILVFTDAGCLPEEEWLERLLKPILLEGEKVSSGPVRSVGKSVYPGLRSPSGEADVDYVSMAATNNLAFRRDAFKAAGGFDESFGSAEDLDFTWRLTDCGYRIRWVQDAVIQHDYGTPERQLRRAFFYGKGQARLLRKHSHRIAEAAMQNPVPIVYALFLIGLPLMIKWRWYPLLLLWPMSRNRSEELQLLVLLDHLAMGAGVLHELVRPGT